MVATFSVLSARPPVNGMLGQYQTLDRGTEMPMNARFRIERHATVASKPGIWICFLPPGGPHSIPFWLPEPWGGASEKAAMTIRLAPKPRLVQCIVTATKPRRCPSQPCKTPSNSRRNGWKETYGGEI